MNIHPLLQYHAPHGDQPQRYEALRAAATVLLESIEGHCPKSRERSLAETKLREALMWANASIACNEDRDPDILRNQEGEIVGAVKHDTTAADAINGEG